MLVRQLGPASDQDKLTYARNQWEALRCYTVDGRLTIDNHVSERTLRHQAMGRKNWLFLGSEAAGPRAAVLDTILACAKRHRIEPWAYVRDLLLRLHAGDQPNITHLMFGCIVAGPELVKLVTCARWRSGDPPGPHGRRRRPSACLSVFD